MKKNIIIIIFTILFSIYVGLSDVDFILNDSHLMIQIILTLLALSFTSYTLIFSPLSRINKKRNINKSIIITFLKKIESSIKYIFYFSMILIAANFIINYDIPFIRNPLNIDFGIVVIKSLKKSIINIIVVLCSLNSIELFFDIMISSFTILKGSIENDIDFE